MGTVISFLQLN